MDLICTHCAEPWDVDHVLHERPELFEPEGAAIVSCPACRGKEVTLDEETRTKLLAAREIGILLGDDVDGYASELEELGLT